MNEYHQQAIHNKNFLECIKSNYPSKFYDWKITVIFYIAIHLLKALGKKRNTLIGESHYDIFNNFDPGRTAKPVTTIPPEIWTTYKRLYKYSKSSRYDGIANQSIRDLALKADYDEVVKLKAEYCQYMDSQHLRLV
ncbi:hypothetical protein [Mucilaginibacter phyllosphaerae]|uniref:Uncharacterized protein n=1 Tax=Mucilaginibacter phyllosphaerae TaxID=1812349 RepID=A0A4Y8ALB7_9SPHI|nr:hypothetical protein [Mucilaginibacter phyllosphaerae]MBB3967741.1 hypothetical protein [Mucilaginibacter phyllosphaerae]TEW69209.1 hypothetical protein E2R65_03310 [Mucilaginibacter phyllosphaerae]GGH03654.1 hypothetical protein GCM10007352_06410 [Mucilaginibacter phyllosphaerae]